MNISDNSNRQNVFLIGNNPQEMSLIQRSLRRSKKMNFIAEVGFDLRDSISKVLKIRPSYILLDDCYPIVQLKKFIKRIHRNNRTQNIPIALLKTSNKNHIRVEGIQDFFLKDSFSPDRLFFAIRNSRKMRRTQIILYKSYKKSRRHYQSIVRYLKNLI